MSDELIGDNNTTGLDLLKLIYIKPGNVTTLNIAFFGKNIWLHITNSSQGPFFICAMLFKEWIWFLVYEIYKNLSNQSNYVLQSELNYVILSLYRIISLEYLNFITISRIENILRFCSLWGVSSFAKTKYNLNIINYKGLCALLCIFTLIKSFKPFIRWKVVIIILCKDYHPAQWRHHVEMTSWRYLFWWTDFL